MPRLGILLACLLFAGHGLAEYCQEVKRYYQQNTGSFFFKREARTKHILELLEHSPNKFKLINDIYVHYRSIEAVSSELSINLEFCLLDLLKISRQDFAFQDALNRRGFFNTQKALDPVHILFAQHIVNANFYPANMPALLRLTELDKLETGFLTHKAINGSYFEPITTGESIALAHHTFKALCEAVMVVDYYGHSIFTNLNATPAEELLAFLGTRVNTQNLEQAIAAYKERSTPHTFDQIRAAVRALYRWILGERLVLSPSEYWDRVLKEAEIIKAEAIAEANAHLEWEKADLMHLSASLHQNKAHLTGMSSKQVFDISSEEDKKALKTLESYPELVRERLEHNIRRAKSNSHLRDLNETKASAELIIKALGEPYEQNSNRIREIFFEQ